MSTSAYAGDGATLSYNSSALANVVSFEISGVKASKIDITNLGSTSHYKEFIPGALDPGSTKAECIYTEALYAAMMTALAGRGTATLLAELPDTGGSHGSRISVSAFVSDVGEKTPTDDKITFSMEFTHTGPLTLSAAA